MEVESRFPAWRKGKVEGIPEEPLLVQDETCHDETCYTCPRGKSRYPAYEYMRKGKFEGIPAPDYDENFFGNIFGKEYFCTTSGSDG
ncbi:hypothetical protein FRX31_034618 [Thalictrum thalictroides]|uniref:Uncharacterized protein n=1 Tax=Thalictrum thalictroides TaxID=46969 RepID=A0A7J6UUE0_THATH|nr:hypothetical protein FRX31_034618 [Thalictrum thalictroides]